MRKIVYLTDRVIKLLFYVNLSSSRRFMAEAWELVDQLFWRAFVKVNEIAVYIMERKARPFIFHFIVQVSTSSENCFNNFWSIGVSYFYFRILFLKHFSRTFFCPFGPWMRLQTENQSFKHFSARCAPAPCIETCSAIAPVSFSRKCYKLCGIFNFP